MKYIETQRQRHIEIRDALFNDPGYGYFQSKIRPEILQNPFLNIWEGFREDVLAYFKKNKIVWWDGAINPPTHLLSSQISCVNHLFFMRQRKDLATLVLKKIDPSIEKALKLDNGFVEFEKTSKYKLGKESSNTRGAHCTSVDAMMLGLRNDNSRVIFLIEWKYTESYNRSSKAEGSSGKTRIDTYIDLFKDTDCPIKHSPMEDMLYEPFYQLMRQTLLAWQMVVKKEYNASDYIHVDIVPKNNIELRNTVTASNLTGKTVEEAWKNCLKPDAQKKYKMLSNNEFIKPIFDSAKIDKLETRSFQKYLNIRYL